MNRRALRNTLFSIILLAIGCSGGGSGCSGLSGCSACGGSSGCATAIPGGFPANQRISNAITAQLSPQGLATFTSNLQTLISTLLGSNGIAVPCISETENVSTTLLGYTISDSIPINVCCGTTCNVQLQFGMSSIVPSSASNGSVNVAVTLPLSINTGNLPLSIGINIPNSIPIIGGDNLCTVNCNVDYDDPNIVVDVTINLAVDPNWGNILAANVELPSPSSFLNFQDLSMSSAGGVCSDIVCDLANDAFSVSFIDSALVSLLSPTITSELQNAVNGFTCQACDPTQFTQNGGCPNPTPNSTNMNPPSASCDTTSNLCMVPSTGNCVPTQLGLQEQVNLGPTLAKYGGSPNTILDVYAVAGGAPTGGQQTTYVDPPAPDAGLVIGLMGGTDAPNPAQCVPLHTAPSLAPVTPINFEAAASEAGLTPVSSYDAAIAISGEYMNKALFDAYSAGVLCLALGSNISSLVATSTFGTFLPSLGFLGHFEDRPMLVALRPKNPPTMTIGLGNLTMNSMGQPEIGSSPLLTVDMRDFEIDFYAFIEERYVRVFTLEAPDFQLPIGLDFDATTGAITPLLGNLGTALTGLTEKNCEMLDSTDCQFFNSSGSGSNNGLSAILGLLPIGSLIPSVSLPTFDGIQLTVDSARGAVGSTEEAGTFQQMALFASLTFPTPMMHRSRTQAKLVESFVPTLSEVEGPEHKLAFPVIELSADGVPGAMEYEFQYRLDGNLWSFWQTSSRLEIHSPVFLLEGRHTIEVRSQVVGDSTTRDPNPVTIEFVVDYAGPKVSFEADTNTGTLTTQAWDAVWKNNLTYSYRLDGAGWSSPSPTPQVFSLSDLNSHKSIEVEVTDGSGHSTTATWGTSPRMASQMLSLIQANAAARNVANAP